MRFEPSAIKVEQGGFLLGTCNRYPEVIVTVQAKRCLREAAQKLVDSLVINGFALDRAGRIDRLVVPGDELQGSYTVMADCREHAVSVSSPRADVFGHTAAQRIGVREQIIEYSDDRFASKRRFP